MIKVLATDLDGTLIPLEGVPENRDDLQRLRTFLLNSEICIIFVTGRHIDSVQVAIAENNLPVPEFIIADVGSSIYRRANANASQETQWEHLADYQSLLDTKLNGQQRAEMQRIACGQSGVRLQEQEKQGRHKLSFYVDAANLNNVGDEISAAISKKGNQFSMICSTDPFNGDGLIDILPAGVSKAFALNWLLKQQKIASSEAIFAGDSGNDYAAMIGGFNTIVVGNASDELRTKVIDFFDRKNCRINLHCARSKATSGVLEGVNQFVANGSAGKNCQTK